jgi:hypothetical protein
MRKLICRLAARKEVERPRAVARALVRRLDGLERQRDPHGRDALSIPVLALPNERGHKSRRYHVRLTSRA